MREASKAFCDRRQSSGCCTVNQTEDIQTVEVIDNWKK